MIVERSVDLLVVVAILFADALKEHQLSLKAVFIADSSGPVQQSRQYNLFIEWVIVGHGVEVVCVGM
jgi:hypothetical protein